MSFYANFIAFLIDGAWALAFALVLSAINRRVKLGKFDWLKIPFSRGGVQRAITTDKTAWSKYGVPVSIGLVILYAFYRFFYQ